VGLHEADLSRQLSINLVDNADMITDEYEYLAERREQQADELSTGLGVSRRDAFRLAAAGGLPLLLGFPELARARPDVRRPVARPAQSPPPGIRKPLPADRFIVRGTNAEMRWEAMRGSGYVTPVDRFFVRNHTSTPDIDRATWRLRVFGSGLRGGPSADEAKTFSLRRLEQLPARTLTVALECAGNGRSLFGRQQGTPAPGTGWGLGAVGVARWTGVPLREVLERAGLRHAAVDVMPEGLDDPVQAADGTDQGRVRRPLPIAKALDDALLAYEMNGRELPPDHGAPVRLVVPGWVGIASVKWLGSIEVADRPLYSPWNTTSYVMVGPDYATDVAPLGVQPVKSAFELAQGRTVTAGAPTTLHGRSWSGGARISSVSVSTDGGATWRAARLHGANRAEAWVRWSVDWTPGAPGPVDLLARATDSHGRIQPDRVPFNRDGYQFWAVARHPVIVV
jgi:DMSO/TMAO reductase YedYZ molybdopterin-dependent catalytic subunit